MSAGGRSARLSPFLLLRTPATQATEIEAHGKKDQSPHGLVKCSDVRHRLSHVSVTIPVY